MKQDAFSNDDMKPIMLGDVSAKIQDLGRSR
jgi:hypothetical protein